MKNIICIVICLIIGLIYMSNYGKAFCVYNYTDETVNFLETGGGDPFKHFYGQDLVPGEHKCCHWTNKDCNKKGKRDSIVKFEAYYMVIENKQLIEKYICKDFPIKAGGWLVVKGSNGRYHCEAGFNP